MPNCRILWLACVCSLNAIAMAAAQAPMNLLLIETDEHNFRTLGCYRELLSDEQAFVWGPEAYVETPHIDSLAARGLLCTSFYATSPVCTPSRAALVSGRYPHNTGAPTNNMPLRDDIRTFAERLRERGYATGYAGKWHLDGDGKPQWQPERTFGFEDNRFMFNRGHWKKLEWTPAGPRVAARSRNGEPSYSLDGADDESFTTDWLTDRALTFIEENADRSFCYMLSIPDPHGPNTVRPPYDKMFDPSLISQPRTFDQTKDQTPLFVGAESKRFSPPGMANYFGMVKCIDDNLGRLLAKLDERNLTDRTIIVFTSDHGDLCGEHHRDNKGNPYEASARVPMVVAAPGKIPSGLVLHQAMSGIDFLPTLLPLLDQPVDMQDVEGRDLSSIFRGASPDRPEEAIFLRRAGTEPGWVAAVTDRYKLVLSPQDEPWLFDLQEDPDELINFYESDQHAAVVRRLADELAAYGPRHQEPHLRHPKMVQDLADARSRGL